MFKKLLFTVSLLALVGMVSAQSLQFELDGTVFSNNQVIACDSLTPWGEMIQEMQIRNLTNETQNVYIMKEEVEMVPGTQNQFCWGNCYLSTIFVSPNPLPVEALSLNDPILSGLSFHQILDPDYSMDPNNFAVGTSLIKYYAYTEVNPDDKVCITVQFAYNPVDVKENVIRIGQAYPNPSSSTVNFNLSHAGVIEATVYNLLGQEVKSQLANATDDRISIAVDDLQPGIYFCSFKANNEVVKTEKFIVKR